MVGVNNLFGLPIRIVESEVMTEKKFRRVKGGYMNRWLLREEYDAPSNQVLIFMSGGMRNIVAHPERAVLLRNFL